MQGLGMRVDHSTNNLFFYYNRFCYPATKALVALLLYNCVTSLDSHSEKLRCSSHPSLQTNVCNVSYLEKI